MFIKTFSSIKSTFDAKIFTLTSLITAIREDPHFMKKHGKSEEEMEDRIWFYFVEIGKSHYLSSYIGNPYKPAEIL